MLTLSRRPHERLMIGDDIQVEVVEIRGDKVRLGFTAPETVPIYRQEVWEHIQEMQRREGGGS